MNPPIKLYVPYVRCINYKSGGFTYVEVDFISGCYTDNL